MVVQSIISGKTWQQAENARLQKQRAEICTQETKKPTTQL